MGKQPLSARILLDHAVFMLLTITTTQLPATDLSRLLVADPDDVRICRFPFGDAMVFFPQHDATRCTAAVLVQPKADRLTSPLSSLGIVLGTVFEAAILGYGAERSGDDGCRPFVVQTPTVVGPTGNGESRARRLFQPLDYDIDVGADGSLWLSTTIQLVALLGQLCVLLPVLDDNPMPEDHEPIRRLLEAAPWLTAHPERALISRRYLACAGSYGRAGAQHHAVTARHCSRHGSTGRPH